MRPVPPLPVTESCWDLDGHVFLPFTPPEGWDTSGRVNNVAGHLQAYIGLPPGPAPLREMASGAKLLRLLEVRSRSIGKP